MVQDAGENGEQDRQAHQRTGWGVRVGSCPSTDHREPAGASAGSGSVGHRPPRLTKRLRGLGIWTAKDLRDANEVRIRDKFSVVQMRTVLELRGIPCIPWKKNA